MSFPLQIDFVNPSTIVYSSGSAVLTANIHDMIESANHALTNSRSTDILAGDEPKLFNVNSNISNAAIFATGESEITALAGNHRDSVIAYSEMDSLEIFISQWPSKIRIGPKGFMMGKFTFCNHS